MLLLLQLHTHMIILLTRFKVNRFQRAQALSHTRMCGRSDAPHMWLAHLANDWGVCENARACSRFQYKYTYMAEIGCETCCLLSQFASIELYIIQTFGWEISIILYWPLIMFIEVSYGNTNPCSYEHRTERTQPYKHTFICINMDIIFVLRTE